jgi:hypothetical protein
VHRHAEPVCGLLPVHSFDAFSDRAHPFAASHRGESTEHEAHVEGEIFAKSESRHRLIGTLGELDAGLRESPEDAVFDQLQVPALEAGYASRRGDLGR